MERRGECCSELESDEGGDCSARRPRAPARPPTLQSREESRLSQYRSLARPPSPPKTNRARKAVVGRARAGDRRAGHGRLTGWVTGDRDSGRESLASGAKGPRRHDCDRRRRAACCESERIDNGQAGLPEEGLGTATAGSWPGQLDCPA